MLGAYLSDSADLALVRGAVAGPRERALLHRAPAVQGDVRGRAQVEGVVGVVVQLVGVGQGLLTGRQDLACLNGRAEVHWLVFGKTFTNIKNMSHKQLNIHA